MIWTTMKKGCAVTIIWNDSITFLDLIEFLKRYNYYSALINNFENILDTLAQKIIYWVIF